MGISTLYHLELSLSIERYGKEEGSNDTARHGVVGVDDGTILTVTHGQSSIKARPE